MIDLTIVIVNYNAGPALIDCLDSLGREVDGGMNLEVRLVDNASTDGSLEQVKAGRPWVTVTANHYNFGFARAVNQALGQATGRYWMLLNPDTLVKPGSLPKLITFADARPTAGAIGPRIIDPDGQIQYSARTAQGPEAFLFNRYSLLTRLWPGNPISRRYLMSDWDHDQVREVDWLSGAALLIRPEAAAEAGLMDEGFFLFHEDVDWCMRIGAAGYGVVYYPGAEVVHHIGISKETESLKLLRIRHQSMIRYIHKHQRRWGPLLWPADLAIAGRFGLLAVRAAWRQARERKAAA